MRSILARGLGLSAVCWFLSIGAVHAAAVATTIATFDDPGTLSFDFKDDADNSNGIGFLTAFNNDIVVDLPSLGQSFSDASYVLSDGLGGTLNTVSQTATSGGLIEAAFGSGELLIKTDIAENSLNAGDVILKATFDSAFMLFGNLFTSDAFMGNDVVFSGYATQGLPFIAESFSFSATNISPAGALLGLPDIEDFTATTSFTSSATVVPLPASAWFFISAIACLLVSRNRAKSRVI